MLSSRTSRLPLPPLLLILPFSVVSALKPLRCDDSKPAAPLAKAVAAVPALALGADPSSESAKWQRTFDQFAQTDAQGHA